MNRTKIAIKARKFAALISGVLLPLAVACSGQGFEQTELGAGEVSGEVDALLASYSDEEVDSIFAVLDEQGVDISTLAADGEYLVVEGDTLLRPSELVEQADYIHMETGDGEVVDKAAYVTSLLRYRDGGWQFRRINALGADRFPGGSGIGLRFASNVPEVWRASIRAAADQWSTNNCININTGSNPGVNRPAIDILWTNLASGAAADATGPGSDGIIVTMGRRIRINSTQGNKNAARRLHISLHEIGHLLGFKHSLLFGASDNGSTLEGTARNRSIFSDVPTYSTIMARSVPATPLGSLSADDILARDLVYRTSPYANPNGSVSQLCGNGEAFQDL